MASDEKYAVNMRMMVSIDVVVNVDAPDQEDAVAEAKRVVKKLEGAFETLDTSSTFEDEVGTKVPELDSINQFVLDDMDEDGVEELEALVAA